MKLERGISVESFFCVVTGIVTALSINILSTEGHAAPWEGVDVWNKWPGYPNDTIGSSNPHLDGHWAPSDAVFTPTNEDPSGPLYGVHAVLLYDEQNAKPKLMLFRDQALIYDLNDPGEYSQLELVSGTSVETPNGHEVFCSGYVHVPSLGDNLLIVGGPLDHWLLDENDQAVPVEIGWASLFDPTNLSSIETYWIPTDNLPTNSGGQIPPAVGCASVPPYNITARYYPTCTLLDDGRILISAGDFWTDCDLDGKIDTNDDGPGGNVNETANQQKWAIYDPWASPGSKWIVEGSGFTNPWKTYTQGQGVSAAMFNYPHIRMLPYGLFYHGNDLLHNAATNPSLLWSPLENWGSGAAPIVNIKNKNRCTSSCIVMTMDATSNDISVLLIGGGADGQQPEGAQAAEIITYTRNSVTGTVTASGWAYTPMNSQMGRGDGNAVLLPDGKVLEIGGEEGVYPEQQNHSCEIFTPNGSSPLGGVWEDVAPLNVDRGHHSVALLLPDGRVFSSGHENCIPHQHDRHDCIPVTGKNYQIYYPPYLFADANTWAARDTIDTYPTTVPYGLSFEITLKDGNAEDINEVVLMAPEAVTHAASFSQGRIRLAHATVPGDAARLIVSGPKDETYAPSRYYMLFVLDDGVPSEARWVKVQRSDYVVPAGQTERWGAKVWLDRDFKVQPGGTLEILPGTEVFASTNTDKANQGIPNRIEVIVEGKILALGSSSAPIVMRGTADTSVDEWFGIRFIDTSDNAISKLRYVNLRDTRQAITPDSLSGDIFHCTFERSQVADIYLERDIRIPAGYEWNLDAPTTAKATPTSLGPDGPNPGKVDIVVDGTLRSQRPGGGSGWVTFTSTTQNQLNGDDWGGITFRPGATAQIKDADLGYAIDPVHFMGASLPSITDSRVHHYKDQGILDTSSKATIQRCRVERGAGFFDPHLNSGIKLIASAGRVEADTVLWHRNYGISVEYSQTFCNAPPGPLPDTVFVRNNVVLGLGPSDPTSEGNPADTGINLSWICNHIVGIVESDSVRFWSRGESLFNCADVKVFCERLADNYIGMHYERNCALPPAGEGGVLLERCKLKSNFQYGLKVPKPMGLTIGGPYTYAPVGLNAHQVDPYLGPPIPSRFVNISNQVDPCYMSGNFEFGQNAWFQADGTLITLATDVSSKIDGTGASRVRVTPLLSAEQTCSLQGNLLVLAEEEVADEALTTTDAPSRLAVPSVFALRIGAPSPAAGTVRIEYDVPSEPRASLSMGIYDVTGRRVTEIRNLNSVPGFHATEWEGELDSGGRAADGVYFIVLRSEAYKATRKVLLRTN